MPVKKTPPARIVHPTARPFLPAVKTLPRMQQAVQKCQGCDLYLHATQAVFGAGPPAARLMFVGEQPGDQEDLAGRPFVGPAGKLLDKALAEAGLPREQVYVTNAVKHFKFEPRGRKRLHAKPSARQVSACRPWLEAEIAVVQPHLIVCLGATAAQTLLGPAFRLTKQRGKVVVNPEGLRCIATYHPSALLRAAAEPDDFRRMWREFVRDLRAARKESER